MLLDDPGRVKSQIISVVCQIQWFDFDCILVHFVVSRKVIIRIPPVLGLKPLYIVRRPALAMAGVPPRARRPAARRGRGSPGGAGLGITGFSDTDILK